MTDQIRKPKILELACKAGKLVLTNGGEIYRVEQIMASVCEAYGIDDHECFATPTMIMLSTSGMDGEPVSRMMRITERSINLNVVAEINDFSRKLPIPFNEAVIVIDSIEKSKPYPLWLRIMVSSIAVGAFAFTFGGGVRDFLCGIVLGMLLRFIIFGLHRGKVGDFMINLVGGAFAAFGGWLVYFVGITDNHWIITISTIMLLVPGLLFTNAMRDIAAGDLVSGVTRGIEVLSIAAALASGVAAVYGLISIFGVGLVL